MVRVRSNGFRWFVGLAILVILLATGYLIWDEFNHPAVVVRWTTASELSTAGFNLYRSEHADGPYNKVNEVIIPPSSDQLTGGKYSYTDHGVSPGTTYYYELEDIDLDGSSIRHGPIAVTSENRFSVKSMLLFVMLLVEIYLIWKVLLSKPRSAWVKEQNG